MSSGEQVSVALSAVFFVIGTPVQILGFQSNRIGWILMGIGILGGIATFAFILRERRAKEAAELAEKEAEIAVEVIREELTAARQELQTLFIGEDALIALAPQWQDWRAKTGAYLRVMLGRDAEVRFIGVALRMPFGEFVRRDATTLEEIAEGIRLADIQRNPETAYRASEARRDNALVPFQPKSTTQR